MFRSEHDGCRYEAQRHGECCTSGGYVSLAMFPSLRPLFPRRLARPPAYSSLSPSAHEMDTRRFWNREFIKERGLRWPSPEDETLENLDFIEIR